MHRGDHSRICAIGSYCMTVTAVHPASRQRTRYSQEKSMSSTRKVRAATSGYRVVGCCRG
eukprot:2678064-Rhodomonas_salina.3